MRVSCCQPLQLSRTNGGWFFKDTSPLTLINWNYCNYPINQLLSQTSSGELMEFKKPSDLKTSQKLHSRIQEGHKGGTS